ncbi:MULTISPECIES: GNAT family N-acetyltransferase [Rhodococcus]|uniref:GNAT family N-acetyltransferase n=1 Tax=Rhodococcus TaxID=1827 RepID=UPI001E2CC65E|nr:GNAT family N-acetyltransferase [Rhodococcus pyridinivorans]MCD2117805.1 GNAT family N-acetyltransferase [Rhodococcus pyridinivorans]MCZ4626836.1 GNAT family N-acetyltransferase [Rhodococcus pyridinivorans]MCZ4647886.1 GNAT family N-acetyltransferase [Rhodococcus pyridinivorans]MDJ0483757.1 GNAT family N-acetyltransferase [Rhodococcus pyridinivorans]MDV7254101.1 GNAT family N-acetyltransferase [Rhodococcus pyridinivorans]
MSTRVSPLTLSGIEQLPAHARRCVFWELDPTSSPDVQQFADPEFEKEAWLSMVLLEWGSCGQIATIGDKAAGCALYAPPGMVPRAQAFPTAPVSADAILLTSMRTEPHADEPDIGADLIRGVVADLVRRNVRAIEAFGIRRTADVEASDVPYATAALGCSDTECMIDADFLEDMGFEVVAPHYRYPRLRLELDRDHEWKFAVEAALDRLLEESSLTVADLTAGSAVGAH